MDELIASDSEDGDIRISGASDDRALGDDVSTLTADQILCGMLSSHHKEQIGNAQPGDGDATTLWDSFFAGDPDEIQAALEASTQALWGAMLEGAPAPIEAGVSQPGEYPTQALFSRMLDGYDETGNIKTSSQKLVDRVKLFNIIQANMSNGKPSWKGVNKALGLPESNSRARDWWNRKGRGESNKGVHYNQRHPYECAFAAGVETSIYQAIALCRSLAAHQAANCPWIVGDDGRPGVALIPNLDSKDKASWSWWFDQVSPEKQQWMLAIHNMKREESRQIAHDGKCEMLQVLIQEGRLYTDNAAIARRFTEHRSADIDIEESDVSILGSSFRSFYEWAGVTDFSVLEERTRKGSRGGADLHWPGIKSLIDMIERYEEHPTVQLFARHLDRLADAQAKLVAAGMGDQARVSAYWMNGRASDAYKNEVTGRLDAGEECRGGETCLCKKLGLLSPCFFELHHEGQKGREKKKEETDGNGKALQPSQYTDEQMDRQREVLVLVCRFWHRLVDLVEASSSTQKLGRKIRGLLKTAILLHTSERKCHFSDMIADESNLPGFDSHHLAYSAAAMVSCNLEVDSLVLETKKYSEISNIERYCSSWEDFVENLFPELVVTCLIDSRKHKLVHLMLRKHSEFDGAEFPYEYNKKRNVLIYTGELTEEEKEEIALVKQSATGGEESGVVKLPSATKVLEIPANGATRRQVRVDSE